MRQILQIKIPIEWTIAPGVVRKSTSSEFNKYSKRAVGMLNLAGLIAMYRVPSELSRTYSKLGGDVSHKTNQYV